MIDPLYSIDPLIDPLKPIENPLKSKGVLQWTCRTCGFVVGKNGADFACVPGGYCSGADWWVEEELSEVAGEAPGQGGPARGDRRKTRASSRINYIGGRV